MREYVDCYVAFLDILGFKNLLNNSDCNSIKQVFEELDNYKPRPIIKNNEVFKKAQYYIMSDSIVVYIDSHIEDSFIALTEICLQIQLKLTTLETPILIRGAIAKGPLYCKDRIIFGKGLSEAYLLESKLAKYPRVIFMDSVRDIALKNTGKQFVFDYNKLFYKRDDDQLFYIDYLNTFDYTCFLDISSISDVERFDREYFEKLYNYVETILKTETDSSIREKYLWLRKKIYEKIESMPAVKEHFNNIWKKQHDAETKRFDEALKNK